ncbi:MAG TPA: alpha-ketoglutarate-dependent dioxygenase AlkB [Acidimicrobiia bacterium]|nr:alpha-ketoglutarate-dependent dioxygenase AlkB [Acidimicrobiia bacterium]
MAQLQRSLFGGGEPAIDPDVAFERIDLDDGAWVEVARGWLRGADTLLEHVVEHVPWTQGRRWMYDRMLDDPRLSRWYRARETPPHPVFVEMGLRLERRYRVPLGGVGLNYYRDGRDSVAFHRDRELRHLDDTLIAIVTLGARRPFLLRSRAGGPSTDLAPASGDLLVMGGATQVRYEHAVPKVAHCGPRVSASWRWSSKRGRPEEGGSWRAPRRFGDIARGERRADRR